MLAAEQAARAEFEHASRMKDEFLATLSHELRTPLNAVLGWVHILHASKADAAMVAEGLAVIDRNARAQTRIIEDILDMSRIISGKMRLDVQDVDLAALVQSGVETVQPTATSKGVRLTQSPPLSACIARGDLNRLHQVFWNLINNVVKFTPSGGEVSVLLKPVGTHVKITSPTPGKESTRRFCRTCSTVFDRPTRARPADTRAWSWVYRSSSNWWRCTAAPSASAAKGAAAARNLS